MRTCDDGAALLADFQRQRGRGVSLRPLASLAQDHHLQRRRCHGDPVTNRKGHGVFPGGEAGVPVEENVAGDVAEGEGVA